jgi:hypothetical protein
LHAANRQRQQWLADHHLLESGRDEFCKSTGGNLYSANRQCWQSMDNHFLPCCSNHVKRAGTDVYCRDCQFWQCLHNDNLSGTGRHWSNRRPNLYAFCRDFRQQLGDDHMWQRQ